MSSRGQRQPSRATPLSDQTHDDIIIGRTLLETKQLRHTNQLLPIQAAAKPQTNLPGKLPAVSGACGCKTSYRVPVTYRYMVISLPKLCRYAFLCPFHIPSPDRYLRQVPQPRLLGLIGLESQPHLFTIYESNTRRYNAGNKCIGIWEWFRIRNTSAGPYSPTNQRARPKPLQYIESPNDRQKLALN